MPIGNRLHSENTTKVLSSNFQTNITKQIGQTSLLRDEKAPESDEMEKTEIGKRKKAFVHIGPHKTGTSALQQALLVDYKLQMTKDGFVAPTASDLPGNPRRPAKSHANLADCLLQDTDKTCPHGATRSCNPKLWDEKLPAFMQRNNEGNESLENPKSLFLSAEGFHLPCIETVRMRDLLSDYHVTILAVHRPFYDWITSRHSQDAKNRFPAISLGFVDWINDPSRFDTFEEYQSVFETAYLRNGTNGLPLFDDIVVMDYAEVKKREAGLPAVVACDILQARHTCKAISKEVSVEENVNDDVDKNSFTTVNLYQAIDYQRIVEAAWEKNMIGSQGETHTLHALQRFEKYNRQHQENKGDPTLAAKAKDAMKQLISLRHENANKLQTWWEGEQGKSLLDLPHTCIGKDVLDRVKELSWKYYLRMRPFMVLSSDHHDKSLESLRNELDSTVQAQHYKYCTVDVARVVNDQSWHDILLA